MGGKQTTGKKNMPAHCIRTVRSSGIVYVQGRVWCSPKLVAHFGDKVIVETCDRSEGDGQAAWACTLDERYIDTLTEIFPEPVEG